MPSETELKFDISRRRLGTLIRRSGLKAFAQAGPKTETLVSVYFDTGKRALRGHRLALRVRRIGRKYLQTVKCGSSGVDREEWEREIPGDAPDRDLARHKLRIAVKKLRYAAGFFDALYGHGNRRKEQKLFMTRLKALQSALGRLNDIRAHEEFAWKKIRKGRRGSVSLKQALGLGFVTGREREAAADCLAAAIKAGKRIDRRWQYWR